MSLRDRLARSTDETAIAKIYGKYGVTVNPYPASSQTTENPHLRTEVDDEIESRIESFMRDRKSQVIVVEGTQGTGKTNILNFFENELREVLPGTNGYYLVRYLSDPEASFDGILRRLFQELGPEYLSGLGKELSKHPGRANAAIDEARNHEVRIALRKLVASDGNPDVATFFHEWLTGLRLLKSHREALGVNFRLDTVESKTAAFRDIILVSSKAELLNGVFLLLDELEKQDGVLSATAVARYLSAMRAIIDALPNHLFMMIAVTPDALRRYSLALPAFRSRLENRVELLPLVSGKKAAELADFYLEQARAAGRAKFPSKKAGSNPILSAEEVADIFEKLFERAKKRNDTGLRQREFLHALHQTAEDRIRALTSNQTQQKPSI